MFHSCSKLTNIQLLNTSLNSTTYYMFTDCKALESIPELDFSQVSTASYMFKNCSSLKTVPRFDMPKCSNMYAMFENCSSLVSITFLNATSNGNFGHAFMGCTALVVCNVFGLVHSLFLDESPCLSKESVLYIFENAQTVSGKTITLHADVFDQLTEDEIAIATEKGFSVVSA